MDNTGLDDKFFVGGEWAHLQNNNYKGGGIMVDLDLTGVDTRYVTHVTGLSGLGDTDLHRWLRQHWTGL